MKQSFLIASLFLITLSGCYKHDDYKPSLDPITNNVQNTIGEEESHPYYLTMTINDEQRSFSNVVIAKVHTNSAFHTITIEGKVDISDTKSEYFRIEAEQKHQEYNKPQNLTTGIFKYNDEGAYSRNQFLFKNSNQKIFSTHDAKMIPYLDRNLLYTLEITEITDHHIKGNFSGVINNIELDKYEIKEGEFMAEIK